MVSNTRVVLARHIEDNPTPETFRIETIVVPDVADGQVLVKIEHLSLDPYMRNRMTAMKSYAQGVALGEVIVGETVGTVISSHHDGFEPGQVVIGKGGWQEYYVSDGSDLRRLPANDLSPSLYLGVLGMPGLTAWVAVHEIGAARAGETVVAPAATGPLGATIGQIAQRLGARAVGVVGGPQKAALARAAYGFDAVVDHRSSDLASDLATACPDGIDVYVDTVGGAVLSAATPLMNIFGRIPLVGTIADYGELSTPGDVNLRPAFTRAILVNRLRVQGLLVYDHDARREEFEAVMTPWLLDGSLTYREEIHEGIESAPEAFIAMLRGEHHGKVVVRPAPSA